MVRILRDHEGIARPEARRPEARRPEARRPEARRPEARRLLVFVFLGLPVAAAEDAEACWEPRRRRGCAGRLVRLRYPEGRVRGGQGLQARGVVVGAAGERAQSAGDPRPSLTGNRAGHSPAGLAARPTATGPTTTGHLAAGPTATGHLASGGVATGTSTLGLLLRLLAPDALLGRPAHPRNRRHARHAATTEHLAHHLLALEEPHNEVVDLAHRDPGASSYASPPGSVEYLGVCSLLRGHRIDDGRGPVQVAVVDLAEQLPVLRRAGQHAEQVPDRPELADHGQLLDEVLEGEPLAGGELAGHRGGLVLVEG